MSFKIISAEWHPIGKQVNYFGMDIEIPIDTVAIATDGDGEVYAYLNTIPTTSSYYPQYWSTHDCAILLGRIDFKGNVVDSLMILEE
mgnify:FL=1